MSDDEDNSVGSDEPMEDTSEEVTDEQIASLQAEVSANPQDYDKRIQLIALLRAAGELDALRAQRESTSSIFAMPPKFWMEWIGDEKTCESDKEVIKSLFERAINDFHSPEVLVEYVQWACGVSIEFAREKMEQAVGLIGLRADCASTIWNIYLDLERMVLESQEGEQADKHRVLIEGIYARLLRIPHIGIETTLSDYETFTEGKETDAMKTIYKNTVKRMRDIVSFESQLEDDSLSVEEQLNILNEYIGMEIQDGDPARVQMMFERALVVSASEPNANLWLQYGSWLDSSLKVPSVAVKVYERAVRHAACAALWQQYLSALERANTSPEVIDSKWPIAKETISTADEGLSLYRTYIYLMRRRVVATGGDYSKVEEIFDEGSTFLQERFGQHWDSPKAQYRKNHALFLYTVAKQPDKGRKIWNDILASGSGHLASAWLEAAKLERFFGKVEVARKVLYRAINSASDHPFMVYEALIQFEREMGTLEELDRALEKVNAQAARVASRPQKKKAEPERGGRAKKESDSLETRGKEDKQASKGEEGVSPSRGPKREHEKGEGERNGHLGEPEEKRAKGVVDKDGFTVPTMPAVGKKKKEDESQSMAPQNASEASSSTNGPSEDQAKTVFISNLDFKLPKERIMEVFPNAKEVRFIHRGMSKLHKGFGYVDFGTAEEAREALRKDRMQIDGRPMYVSVNKPHERGERAEFRYATNLEKNKLFVGNVHYDATAEQVKEVFSVFGSVRDVRIVTHKSGKSKGCAYVEFEDEPSASAAIKAEEVVLLERKLSVALSNPPKRRDPSAPVKNLSTSMAHQRSKIDLKPRALSRGKPETPVQKSGDAKPVGKLSNDQFRSFLKK